ncbi:MAG: hypothetical protein ACRCYU_00140, partial [Nocardioides sp.]
MRISGPLISPVLAGATVTGAVSLVMLVALCAPAGAVDDPATSGAGALSNAAPTDDQVTAAKAAADASALDVAEVQDRLAAANRQLWQASVVAEQAAEAFNGARWRWHEAIDAARAAAREHRAASAEADRQRQIYADALVVSYEMAPELTALSAIVESDGIETLISRSSTMAVAESALSARYVDLTAANQRAAAAARRATDTRSVAAEAASASRQ